MAIHVALHHKTEYRYDRPVSLAPQVIRLRPAPQCRTPILSYSLQLKPEKHFMNWLQDPHGNYLARVVLPDRTTRFSLAVDLVAEMAVFNPFDFFLEPSAEAFPFHYDPQLQKELTPYLERSACGSALGEFLAGIDRSERETIDFLVELNRSLAKAITYTIRREPGVQTP